MYGGGGGYTAERLAVLDGDTDKIITLLGGDLTAPHQFIRVAEAMLELDRSNDALAWARRGIESTNGWQVAKLMTSQPECSRDEATILWCSTFDENNT